MKKKLVILFLGSVYLFGATDADQLLKLPLLITHYVKHKKENPQTTFNSFLKMHYVDPQPFDEDYQQDMKLPFKTITHLSFRSIPSLLSQPPVVKHHILKINREVPPTSNEAVFSSLLVHKIFQPPRA